MIRITKNNEKYVITRRNKINVIGILIISHVLLFLYLFATWLTILIIPMLIILMTLRNCLIIEVGENKITRCIFFFNFCIPLKKWKFDQGSILFVDSYNYDGVMRYYLGMDDSNKKDQLLFYLDQLNDLALFFTFFENKISVQNRI